MEQQKNLHASVPDALLAKAREAASARPFWQSFTDRVHALPDEVFEKLPADAASEHDHYLYGSPKRSA